MPRKSVLLILGFVIAQILYSSSYAGPFADDMARCLVRMTTPDEKGALARWMFVVMSRHPVVGDITNVTDEEVSTSNQVYGEIIMKLLTERCLEESKAAVQYEGPAVIQTSFQLLGQVAAAELMSHPNTQKVMADLPKYLDVEKLSVLGLSKE